MVIPIEDFDIDYIKSNYYKLIVVINRKHIDRIYEEVEFKGINLNVELTAKLLDYPVKKREHKVSDITQDLINDFDSNSVLLEGIEVLFTRHLNVDPIELLKSNSRNKLIIVNWPGELTDNTLTYAIGHLDEFKYKINNEFLVIGG